MGADTLEYHYKFTFPDGSAQDFCVRLDARSLRIRDEVGSDPPGWTRLGCCQCPNCPLSEDVHPFCPVAKSLVGVIDFFKDRLSIETVSLEVSTEARAYRRDTPLAKGVSSLIGLHMVTSGCPILGKLKPMVRIHLPFPMLPETHYRMLAMYMLAQHFRMTKGKEPDWELKGLIPMLNEIRDVNMSFCSRLKAICPEDASLNAVIRLDCFADSSSVQVEDERLDLISESFDAYLS
ncbi:DUF6901 family protein [Elusimicrobiota bacterium]